MKYFARLDDAMMNVGCGECVGLMHINADMRGEPPSTLFPVPTTLADTTMWCGKDNPWFLGTEIIVWKWGFNKAGEHVKRVAACWFPFKQLDRDARQRMNIR